MRSARSGGRSRRRRPVRRLRPRGVLSLETYGRYQLLKKLATGGMAQIYLARQLWPEGFEKLLVVKRILPHLAGNDDFITMFLDEARIAARLNHPNVVQIFDLGAQKVDAAKVKGVPRLLQAPWGPQWRASSSGGLGRTSSPSQRVWRSSSPRRCAVRTLLTQREP